MIKFTFFFIVSILFCQNPIYSQFVPKFDKSFGDTLALFSNLPVVVSIKLGQSDPSLISLKSSEISNYMISKFDDSTFVININRPVNEAKLKLYYKNMPVDLYTATLAALDFPKILVLGKENIIEKDSLVLINSLNCSIEESYSAKYRVHLHSFNINIVHLNGRKEIIPNFNMNIASNNLLRIRSLPADTAIYFTNIKLRTIYNNVIEIKGDSNKFILSE
jgi:hypothetical protein